MTIHAGQVLSQRYRLIRPLGQGSQASVWVAEHLALSTTVAVKLIDPELAKKDEARERFRREATAAAQLRSAHVEGIPVLGTVYAVEKVMTQGIADWVVVTSKRRDEDLPDDQLLSLKLQGVPIFSGVSLYERITGEVYHRSMRSSVLIFDDRLGMTLFERFTKRAFDLVIALAALVITAPMLLAAAIGWSRVKLERHSFGQVLSGALVGAIAGIVFLKIIGFF